MIDHECYEIHGMNNYSAITSELIAHLETHFETHCETCATIWQSLLNIALL